MLASELWWWEEVPSGRLRRRRREVMGMSQDVRENHRNHVGATQKSCHEGGKVVAGMTTSHTRSVGVSQTCRHRKILGESVR